jgi:hypothetical protein
MLVRTVGVEPTSPSGAAVLETAVFAVPPHPHNSPDIRRGADKTAPLFVGSLGWWPANCYLVRHETNGASHLHTGR